MSISSFFECTEHVLIEICVILITIVYLWIKFWTDIYSKVVIIYDTLYFILL